MKTNQNRSAIFTLLSLLFLTNGAAFAQSGFKKVKKLPTVYEYPVDSSFSSSGATAEKPWIVYSDRNNNITYTDAKARTPLNKIGFMESFLVVDEKEDLVELIKYAPDILESAASIKIKNPTKIQYTGWIQKSKLILSSASFVENSSKRPLKWVTMINGNKIFDKIKNHTEGERIRLYDGPELQVTLKSDLYFDELVYAYKRYEDKLLLGKQSRFTPENAADIILGWVPSTFVQMWGQRLCLEPLPDSVKKNPPVIYATKDLAINYPTSNLAKSYILTKPGCEKIALKKWKKYPVFKLEEVKKDRSTVNLLHTGAVTSTFDKGSSFIYNINGAKLNYTKLCDIANTTKYVNIAIAINAGADTREYLFALTGAIQELGSFFNAKKSDYQFRFAAVDCLPNSTPKVDFTDQYSKVLPVLITMAQSSVEGKNTTNTSGIGNGLTNAVKLFKGREEETNIVLIISSQADADSYNRSLKESLYEALGQKNIRLLLLQPYAGAAPSYSEFVQQAKTIIEKSADKAMVFKRDKLVAGSSTGNQYKYRTIMTGDNNVYCLDFPSNAPTQGFFVFPTIGNKVTGKYLNDALDSLLTQINQDNQLILSSLGRVFNSASSFNNSINKTFEAHYKQNEPFPGDVGYYLNNVDYSYFIPGYTSYPTSATDKPFKYSLLLSTDEYEDIYNVFKDLKFDQINQQYDLKTRSVTYDAFSKLLTNYAYERHISIPIYSLTFAQFFSKLCGFYSNNELLNKYKVYDLNNPNLINKDDLKKMVDYINNRVSIYYALRSNNKFIFTSNGVKYYWVSEDYLP